MNKLNNGLNKLSPQQKAELQKQLARIATQKQAAKTARNKDSKNKARDRDKDIAIIGIACRFPGEVSNLDQYWKLLQTNQSVIKPIPELRFTLPSDSHHGAKVAGLINDIDKFDAAFFRMPPILAKYTDPQQRLMLTLSQQALVDAGYSASDLTKHKTGVFTGVCNYDYREIIERAGKATSELAAIGTFPSLMANRISFFHNFRGPSVTIDTACSSSLVAVHQAKQSINSGDCDYALAGGVNLICTPTNSLSFAAAGMLSPTGQCRTFDAEADGYIRGEGAGIMVLKSLARAEQDGDRIYGVIRGSAINHGGAANTLTSPNPQAQAEVIVAAMQDADCSSEDISYIEAHGTGTKLGDPLEVEGLNLAFKQLSGKSTKQPHCALGSVKPTIGHLESAAGIAGLLKILVLFRYKSLVGIANFNQPNPHLQLEDTPFYINQENQFWQPTDDHNSLKAGVSSFGFGGANAHVVLESYEQKPKRIDEIDW